MTEVVRSYKLKITIECDTNKTTHKDEETFEWLPDAIDWLKEKEKTEFGV